jgi:hypothetical protein
VCVCGIFGYLKGICLLEPSRETVVCVSMDVHFLEFRLYIGGVFTLW